MPLDWQRLFELADGHGFVIASDECYSEIYFRDEPPLWALQAARTRPQRLRNLVVFTSLSKRSSVPGCARASSPATRRLRKFLLYRTYHGSAMSPLSSRRASRPGTTRRTWWPTASCTAASSPQVTPMLRRCSTWRCRTRRSTCGRRPGGDDIAYRRGLLAQYNVPVLPGSLLARKRTANPGRGRIRMALVADVDECLEAAHRIVSYTESPS